MPHSQPKFQQLQQDGTLGKSLALLDLVASATKPPRFADLLALSEHPKATLHRLLKSLVTQNMLTYDIERQTYSLGVRLVGLAHAAWRQSSLAPVARPFVDTLARETGLTVHLAQLAGAQVLYVDKRNAHQSVEMFSQAGKVGPAYCTGVGKAMLAYLDEAELDHALAQQSFHKFTPATHTDAVSLKRELALIRASSLSFDREEHELGIICIAAPILSSMGLPLGAISLTTTTQQSSLESLNALQAPLQDAAQKIAAVSQAWRFPASGAEASVSQGTNPCMKSDNIENGPDAQDQTGGSHVSSHA